MRKVLAGVGVAVLTVVAAGCYHATIETGRAPSTEVISKSFAAGWIFGLVPPSTVETAAKCPNGVAKVETQLSFVNQLVAFLTLDIYTPMTIEVTCASKNVADAATARPNVSVNQAQGDSAVRAAFQAAATQSVATHAPVLVQVQ